MVTIISCGSQQWRCPPWHSSGQGPAPSRLRPACPSRKHRQSIAALWQNAVDTRQKGVNNGSGTALSWGAGCGVGRLAARFHGSGSSSTSSAPTTSMTSPANSNRDGIPLLGSPGGTISTADKRGCKKGDVILRDFTFSLSQEIVYILDMIYRG